MPILKHLIRKGFKRNIHVTSPRLVVADLKRGYAVRLSTYLPLPNHIWPCANYLRGLLGGRTPPQCGKWQCRCASTDSRPTEDNGRREAACASSLHSPFRLSRCNPTAQNHPSAVSGCTESAGDTSLAEREVDRKESRPDADGEPMGSVFAVQEAAE